MGNEIFKILNDIVKDISNAVVPIDERENITFNINKNESISFNVFKNILLKITFQKTKMFIEIRKLNDINIEKISKDFSEIKYKESDTYLKIYINDIEEIRKLDVELKEIYKYLYLNEPIEPFGCCSKFVQCSDALKCINPDKKMSKGCRIQKKS